MPAELIRICGFLNLALTSVASRLTSLSLVMSAVKVSTLPPLAFSSPATLSSLPWLRPTSAIWAPAPESVCAMASPRPPEPPTMIAVLPLRSIFTCKPSCLREKIRRATCPGRGTASRPRTRRTQPPWCAEPCSSFGWCDLQNDPAHHRRDKAGEIAQHVHGGGNGRGILLADLDAGVPADRHGQVAGETRQQPSMPWPASRHARPG